MPKFVFGFLFFVGGLSASERRVLPERPQMDLFSQQWEEHENALLLEKESELLSLQRLGRGRIQKFLDWWERKYELGSAEKERVYVGLSPEEPELAGRFWDGLEPQAQRNLRLAWYSRHSRELLAEVRLFIASAATVPMHSFEEEKHHDNGDKHADSESNLENHRRSRLRRTYAR